MALQSSGTITFAQIQAEFGGSNPISLSEYYRGGSYVPNTTVNSSIPTSGTITMSNFYSGSNTAAAWSSADFNSSTNVARNSVNTSNTLSPTITGSMDINVSGGISASFSIAGGSFSATTRAITTGQNITARGTASASYNTASALAVNGNGDSLVYLIQTGSAPPPPPPPPPTGTCLAASEPIYIHSSSADETIGDLVVGDTVNSFNSPTIIDETNPNWEAWSEADISDGANLTTNIVRADSFLVGSYIVINGQLKCTEPHPLLAQRGGLWQWIRANALEVGDNLYGFDATAIPVTSLDTVNEQLQVVDVGAENVDTYFAGKIDGVYILNHNK
tara:strand:- start:54 stop:1052 length:999 start_codon:yes stop_codon:yes gene_type:complete